MAAGARVPAWHRIRRIGRLVTGVAALHGGAARAQPSHPSAGAPGAGVETAPSEAVAPEAGEPSDPAVHRLLSLAKERFDQGVLANDAASLERALDALRLGIRLSSAPGLEYNAARVEQQLGHCAEATERYRRFLGRAAAGAGRERAERQLELLGACDASEPSQSSWVVPGVSHELQLSPLAPSLRGPPVVWAELEQSADVPEPVSGERWAVWGLAGATAIGLTVTSIFLVRAWRAQGDIDDLRDQLDSPTAGSRLAKLQERGRDAQSLARVFGGLTAALGLATGVGFWWTSNAAHAAHPELAGALQGTAAIASWSGPF